MKNNYRRFYFASLALLLALSAYPLIMGAKAIFLYLKNGFVDTSEYGKYVIPYTPICLSLLVLFLCYPIILKRLKKLSLLFSSVISALLFVGIEVLFEKTPIADGAVQILGPDETVASWQLGLCMATPESLKALGQPIYAQDNPAYKIHFYLISIIILFTVLYLLDGFSRRFLNTEQKLTRRPLVLQLILTAVFIGLCVFANLTSFFRNGTIFIDPLSSFLTGGFFVVLGLCLGGYLGCLLYFKNKWLSLILPSLAASLTCIAMYSGEAALLNGELYRFGTGFFFQPIGNISLAPVDFCVILFSGILTYFSLSFYHRISTKKVPIL